MDETERHLTYGTVGWNGLRRHLAQDHGLAADPEFGQHVRSRMVDMWTNRDLKWQNRKHYALHGREYPSSKRRLRRAALAVLTPGWVILWQARRSKEHNPHNAPQWKPDPFVRHELRWWDGSEWTDKVSDGGIPSVDPFGAVPPPPPPPPTTGPLDASFRG